MLSEPQAHLPVRRGGDCLQAARRQLRDEGSDRPAPLQDHQQPHVGQGEPKGLHTDMVSTQTQPCLLVLLWHPKGDHSFSPGGISPNKEYGVVGHL